MGPKPLRPVPGAGAIGATSRFPQAHSRGTGGGSWAQMAVLLHYFISSVSGLGIQITELFLTIPVKKPRRNAELISMGIRQLGHSPWIWIKNNVTFATARFGSVHSCGYMYVQRWHTLPLFCRRSQSQQIHPNLSSAEDQTGLTAKPMAGWRNRMPHLPHLSPEATE